MCLSMIALNFDGGFNWVGIAMVEWLIHPTTNEPYLIEINPRFWGSLEVAIRSGVGFPTLYVNSILGVREDQIHRITKSVRARWFFPGEILRYISTPRRERERFPKLIASFFSESDEYDSKDKIGAVFTFVYMISLIFKPKYWSLLKR